MSETRRQDGGPAFPATAWHEDLKTDVAVSGMSLRDYFAAHNGATLQVHVFVGETGEIQLPDPTKTTDAQAQALAEWKAKFSYAVADAMLAERAK